MNHIRTPGDTDNWREFLQRHVSPERALSYLSERLRPIVQNRRNNALTVQERAMQTSLEQRRRSMIGRKPSWVDSLTEMEREELRTLFDDGVRYHTAHKQTGHPRGKVQNLWNVWGRGLEDYDDEE